jgi:hypothetical protein
MGGTWRVLRGIFGPKTKLQEEGDNSVTTSFVIYTRHLTLSDDELKEEDKMAQACRTLRTDKRLNST